MEPDVEDNAPSTMDSFGGTGTAAAAAAVGSAPVNGAAWDIGTARLNSDITGEPPTEAPEPVVETPVDIDAKSMEAHAVRIISDTSHMKLLIETLKSTSQAVRVSACSRLGLPYRVDFEKLVIEIKKQKAKLRLKQTAAAAASVTAASPAAASVSSAASAAGGGGGGGGSPSKKRKNEADGKYPPLHMVPAQDSKTPMDSIFEKEQEAAKKKAEDYDALMKKVAELTEADTNPFHLKNFDVTTLRYSYKPASASFQYPVLTETTVDDPRRKGGVPTVLPPFRLGMSSRMDHMGDYMGLPANRTLQFPSGNPKVPKHVAMVTFAPYNSHSLSVPEKNSKDPYECGIEDKFGPAARRHFFGRAWEHCRQLYDKVPCLVRLYNDEKAAKEPLHESEIKTIVAENALAASRYEVAEARAHTPEQKAALVRPVNKPVPTANDLHMAVLKLMHAKLCQSVIHGMVAGQFNPKMANQLILKNFANTTNLNIKKDGRLMPLVAPAPGIPISAKLQQIVNSGRLGPATTRSPSAIALMEAGVFPIDEEWVTFTGKTIPYDHRRLKRSGAENIVQFTVDMDFVKLDVVLGKGGLAEIPKYEFTYRNRPVMVCADSILYQPPIPLAEETDGFDFEVAESAPYFADSEDGDKAVIAMIQADPEFGTRTYKVDKKPYVLVPPGVDASRLLKDDRDQKGAASSSSTAAAAAGLLK